MNNPAKLAITDHDDFGGAQRDLPRLLSRRSALISLASAGLGAIALAACGSGDGVAETVEGQSATSSAAASTESTASSAAASTESTASSAAGVESSTVASTGAAAAADIDVIPSETGGPYPGDGSNGPNVLAESGVVRSDITKSIGSASGVAEGVPLTINLTIVDASKDGAAFGGASVYLWHATRDGQYSMYSTDVADENYLRGVQEAAADGTMTFQTIFPGCYDGRWPHIHFEVYNTLADTTGGSPRVTSQIALPEESCVTAYAADGYSVSVSNLSRTSLARDMVFSDGAELQLPTMSGDVASGFVANLTVAV